MSCPICCGDQIPDDASEIEMPGKRVILQGRVYAIIPAGYTYSPYKDYATVSLYPQKGKVKYLKFRTDDELKKWAFEKDVKFIVRGCMHIIDGKELVFDITSADRVKL
jgi:hypothetical protein